MKYAAKVTSASQLGFILELAKNKGLSINPALHKKTQQFPTEGIIVSLYTSKNYNVNWCKPSNQNRIAGKTSIGDFSAQKVLDALMPAAPQTFTVEWGDVKITGTKGNDTVDLHINDFYCSEVDLDDLTAAVEEAADQI